jgi:acetyl-CoA synthetase
MSDRYPVPDRVRAGSQSPIQSLDDWRRVWMAAQQDPDAFWLDETRRRLRWQRPPTEGLVGNFRDVAQQPIRCFADGRLNITESLLDRHLEERPDKTAIL